MVKKAVLRGSSSVREIYKFIHRVVGVVGGAGSRHATRERDDLCSPASNVVWIICGQSVKHGPHRQESELSRGSNRRRGRAITNRAIIVVDKSREVSCHFF